MTGQTLPAPLEEPSLLNTTLASRRSTSRPKVEDRLRDRQETVGQLTPSGPLQAARKVVTGSLGPWIAAAAIASLIFGGCCSNVYALEAIVQVEAGCGTLLTFVQFLFVAITGYISQFDRTRPPLFIAENKVPVSRWIVNILLFFAINVLNNHAFSYDISVPVHIILRSGGPITTIGAGWLWGKKFTRTQAIAAIFMTLGVAIAAWSDARAKDGGAEPTSQKAPFSTGVIILFLAMTMSACMGLYTEEVYKIYGPQWRENLFYSHILSLPLFLPFAPGLAEQLYRLARSRPLNLSIGTGDAVAGVVNFLPAWALNVSVPSQLAYLALNVLTQYACIRGVNLLAAEASALTVVIALNVRKLVSLLLSIWLFGNKLSPGTLLGALVVFGAAGLYSLGGKAKQKKM